MWRIHLDKRSQFISVTTIQFQSSLTAIISRGDSVKFDARSYLKCAIVSRTCGCLLIPKVPNGV